MSSLSLILDQHSLQDSGTKAAQTAATTTLTGPPQSFVPIYLKIIIGIFLVLVIFVSIFGNLLVCVAIASDRRLRRLGNLFLVSLAIADLCVGALVMTFALANDLMGYWPFWPQLCEIWIAFDISCSTCSIINMCAIALDRFAHIKDPMFYNRWMNKRIVVSSVSIIWLVSCLIAFLPISLGWHRPVPEYVAAGAPNSTTQFSVLGTIILTDAKNDSDQPTNPDEYDDFELDSLQRSIRNLEHYLLFKPILLNDSIMAIELNASASYYLPEPVFAEDTQPTQSQQVSIPGVRHSRHSSFAIAHSNENLEDQHRQMILMLNQEGFEPPTGSADQPQHAVQQQQEQPEPSKEFNQEDHSLPQCALDLTPTYAVVSSCISFYFPCIIMLCLYARLYSICQQHVKSIRSMTKVSTMIPTPINYPGNHTPTLDGKLTKTKSIDHHNTHDDRNSMPERSSNVSIGYQSSMIHHQQQQQQLRQQQQSHVSEHKAAITLGIIMGTFLACWMPFFCMNIVAAFCKTCIPDSVFKILTWLGYFNSCLNPAIYSIFNTEFRDAFRRILVRYVFRGDAMSNACCCGAGVCRCQTNILCFRYCRNRGDHGGSRNKHSRTMITALAQKQKHDPTLLEPQTKTTTSIINVDGVQTSAAATGHDDQSKTILKPTKITSIEDSKTNIPDSSDNNSNLAMGPTKLIEHHNNHGPQQGQHGDGTCTKLKPKSIITANKQRSSGRSGNFQLYSSHSFDQFTTSSMKTLTTNTHINNHVNRRNHHFVDNGSNYNKHLNQMSSDPNLRLLTTAAPMMKPNIGPDSCFSDSNNENSNKIPKMRMQSSKTSSMITISDDKESFDL